ncbi:MAG: hypothetical protein Q9221_000204 [Calogaya cf. arnoldii]
MQSGITASPDLHTRFRSFLTTPSLFALLITITSERLEPLTTIPSSPSSSTSDNTNNTNSTNSTFHTSLQTLTPHLTPTRALYILLRRHAPPHPTPLTCITYIPDSAPVRQKTLFASTRLTLTRQLGAEVFGEGMFATEAKDLSPEGWEGWERHLEGGNEGVLTREEREREDLREQEGGAVGERRMGMVGMQQGGSGVGGMKVGFGEGVGEALGGMGRGERGLVMLKIDQNENITLAGVKDVDIQGLSTAISDTEPRYSFFRYTHDVDGQEKNSIIFIYTCPSGSKVKERMIYASFKKVVMDTASAEAGFEIAKKLEASSPSEITPEMIGEEFQPRQEQKQGFARPKRPGKR